MRWCTSVMPRISVLGKLRQVNGEREAILEYTENQKPIPVTEWDCLKTKIKELKKTDILPLWWDAPSPYCFIISLHPKFSARNKHLFSLL